MKTLNYFNIKKLSALILVGLSFIFATQVKAQNHPAYLHAISNLKAAKWFIEHRGNGNFTQTTDERMALREINTAIIEIKAAAWADGKNVYDKVPVDGSGTQSGRLHSALDYLLKARRDIAQAENNSSVSDLQNRSYGHIDNATRLVNNAIRAAGY